MYTKDHVRKSRITLLLQKMNPAIRAFCTTLLPLIATIDPPQKRVMRDNPRTQPTLTAMDTTDVDQSPQDVSLAAEQAFAAGLMNELDRIGYPKAPERASQLALALKLGRAQVYRICSGRNFPTLQSMQVLSALGVSFDNVLKSSSTAPVPQQPVRLVLPEGAVSAVPTYALDGKAGVTLTPVPTGFALKLVGESSPTLPTDRPISALTFIATRRPIALIEDDPSTSGVLAAYLSADFEVHASRNARTFFAAQDQIPNFKAVVLDWRLPDSTGLDFIDSLRRLTPVPIIIITGEAGASGEISRALHMPNVHYLTKPIARSILVAVAQAAIEHFIAFANMPNRQ